MKLPRPLAGALVACLFLASAEVALHFVGAFDPAVIEDPYMGFPGSGPLYRELEPNQRPADRTAQAEEAEVGVLLATAPNKASRYRNVAFPRDKPEREFRVFCLGGSSVMSEHYSNPDGSFPHFLERYLRGLSKGQRARVVNAGGAGTGSIQNLEVMREVTQLAADLVVLYPEGGEKNLIPPAPGGLLAQRDEASPARVFARRHLGPTRVYGAARHVYQTVLPATDGAVRLPSAFSTIVFHTLSKPFAEDTFSRLFELKENRPPVLMPHPIPAVEVERASRRFRNTLTSSIRLCRERGVALVLVLPQHNLEHSFYLRFHIDPDELRPGAEDAWRKRYAAGLEAKRAGRYGEALPILESIRELYVEDRDDLLAYFIAQCHRELGDPDQELRELRTIHERHPMIRELRRIAAAEHIPLVDPFEALVDAAGGRVPGHDFFSDAYHPVPRTSRIIAREIARTIDAAGLLPGSAGFETPRMRAVEDACDALLDQIVLPVHARIFEAIRDEDYDRAVAIAGAMAEKRFYGSPVAPFYLGWALTRAGRLQDARRVFLRLKQTFGDSDLELPDLDSDEALVIHAFQGDVFAIF